MGFFYLTLSFICILKYHTGRRPQQEQWVLGLLYMQYIPARPYVQPVRRWNMATVLPIIQGKVQSAFLVYLDQWEAYRWLQWVASINHVMVNHSVNFVDLFTSIHTRHTESSWSTAKKKFKKKMKGNSNPIFLQEYLCGEDGKAISIKWVFWKNCTMKMLTMDHTQFYFFPTGKYLKS